jgi:programmed cell death 6-interacting protein
MAIATVLKRVSEPSAFIGEHKEFGRPLFAQLVPFIVHEKASIYTEQRDRLVNSNIISELEILTKKIYNTLKSLNLLRALQSLEKPLMLPSILHSNIEEVKKALARLQISFTETANLKSFNVAIFSKGREILRAVNERLRCRMKSPYTKVVEALYAQATEIEGYLREAANSDKLVERNY